MAYPVPSESPQHPARNPQGAARNPHGNRAPLPLGHPARHPQVASRGTYGERRALLLLARALPYVLAGDAVAAVVATGPTILLAAHGWTWGAMAGGAVGIALWILKAPRGALALALLGLLLLILPL